MHRAHLPRMDGKILLSSMLFLPGIRGRLQHGSSSQANEDRVVPGPRGALSGGKTEDS